MEVNDIITRLKEIANPVHLAGMERFNVDNSKALGVKLPDLRKLAKSIKKSHTSHKNFGIQALTKQGSWPCWLIIPRWLQNNKLTTGPPIFMLGPLRPGTRQFFDCTPYAISKAIEFSASAKEYVKPVGFVLTAKYAVHNKKATNEIFTPSSL